MHGLTNAARHGRATAGGTGAGGGGGADVELRLRVTPPEGGARLVIEVLDTGRGLLGRTLTELRREFAELPQRSTGAASGGVRSGTNLTPSRSAAVVAAAAARQKRHSSAFNNVRDMM
jgi:hypothetical protein